MTYSVRTVIGTFFEDRAVKLFDFAKLDDDYRPKFNDGAGRLSDLMTRDGTYMFESKASFRSNGGVIREKQLVGSLKNQGVEQFYIFSYHLLQEDLATKYPTPDLLTLALMENISSTYFVPINLVKSFFDSKPARKIDRPELYFKDRFVQMRENEISALFNGDKNAWLKLGILNTYITKTPKKDIFVMAETQKSIDKILKNFNPNAC